MNSHRILFAVLTAAVLCGCAFAQTTSATLQGTVTDPSNAAVPGASVELKDTAMGAVRMTVSTSEGIFRFNSVVPGIYDLTIRPPAGFKEYTQKEITLNASEI